MKRSEQFRQANREAKITCYATLSVIIFWCLAGFGLSESDIKILDTPVWVWGGCVGTWIFAIIVAVFLAQKVITDMEFDEDSDNKEQKKDEVKINE